ERLRPETVRLLQGAAVCGDGFQAEVAQATAGIAAEVLADALDEALDAGMLREQGDRYFFTHALIAQTLSAGLNSARRAALHRRALTALEAAYVADPTPVLGDLARHAAAAALDGADERPFAYATRAAERA